MRPLPEISPRRCSLKPPLRTKSVGTKVSEEEFVALEARARVRKLTLSEWVRAEFLEPDDGAAVEGNSYFGAPPLSFYAGGSTHFQHQGFLGTERVQTSNTGAREGTYSSLVFGDGYTSTGSNQDAYHFAALDHDTETTTDHALFRQYSPTQGRWLRPDPYLGSYDVTNPQSFNRYSYALNNPLRYVDRLGLDECDQVTNLDDGTVPFDGDCGFGGGGGGGGGSVGVGSIGSVTVGGSFFGWGDVGSFGPSSGDGNQFLPLTNFSDLAPTGAASNGGLTPKQQACKATILSAVNNQFATNLGSANVQGDPFVNGGGVNLNLNASGLSATQFNSIQTGRYAPGSVVGVLTGYGPSLHVTGPGLFDKSAYFSNQNIGGSTSVTFTAHIDSAWADNPIGALLHLIIDVFGSKTRNPCP